MKIQRIQTVLPVYITIEVDGENRTIFALIDLASQTIDIPEEKDRALIDNFDDLRQNIFEYYANLNNRYDGNVPTAVYDHIRKSQESRRKAEQIKEKHGR